MKRIGDVLSTISIPIGAASDRPAAEPCYACPVCKDAGWVRLDVPVGHPHFGRLWPCECTLHRRELRLEEDKRRISNLDAFTHHTFDDFEPAAGTDAAFALTTAYAREPDGWLFLHGGCGAGKTHLAVAVAQEVQKSNGNVIFAVVPDLLDHLRATFDPSHGVAYDERFAMIRGAFLLVLDDLGTENTTPWAREKLYQLINHRYNERLPTIVTSNHDLRDLDERIVSRLLDRGLTRDVLIDAEDYRRRGRPDYVHSRGRPNRRGR
ncbi:MAG: ATP-binding protein [Thermomicrobiales bacterium]|nr:ATP-binding protein [Thermomicrobiales bacterium]